jgi:hypothetical protein
LNRLRNIAFARGGEKPFGGGVEADSPEAVLEKIKQQIKERVAQGARIAALEVPLSDNPWLEGAGMFRDDPLFDEWQQAMADYRRAANELPDAP